MISSANSMRRALTALADLRAALGEMSLEGPVLISHLSLASHPLPMTTSKLNWT